MSDFVSKVRVFPFAKHSFFLLLGISCCFLLINPSLAPGYLYPSQTTVQAQQLAVVRLRVKLKVGNSQKSLARKRFFLIKGSKEANKDLVQRVEQQGFVSRDCYYRSIGASNALIRWLQENDCESVYCREIESKDSEGTDAVPEFKQAVDTGEKQFRSREIARKWLTVNLSDELRNGYYRRQQATLQTLLKQAEEHSQAKVLSVMTDRNGTAYFTDVEPGEYVISNLVPIQFGENLELWNCDIKVAPADIGTEKTFLISNKKERLVKCESSERPVPPCP